MNTPVRFLGMPLWPKRLTDEEYVNRVRKGLRVVRWTRWLFAAIFIGGIAFLCWAVMSITDFLTSFSGKDGSERPLIYGVFALAILSGGLIGFWVGHFGEIAVNAFFGFRRDKLLVECWDALQQSKAHDGD